MPLGAVLYIAQHYPHRESRERDESLQWHARLLIMPAPLKKSARCGSLALVNSRDREIREKLALECVCHRASSLGAAAIARVERRAYIYAMRGGDGD